MDTVDKETQHRDELLELLKERKLVLMVGAGSSLSVGYPLWPPLLENLRVRLGFPTPWENAETLGSFADRVKSFAQEKDPRGFTGGKAAKRCAVFFRLPKVRRFIII